MGQLITIMMVIMRESALDMVIIPRGSALGMAIMVRASALAMISMIDMIGMVDMPKGLPELVEQLKLSIVIILQELI